MGKYEKISKLIGKIYKHNPKELVTDILINSNEQYPIWEKPSIIKTWSDKVKKLLLKEWWKYNKDKWQWEKF